MGIVGSWESRRSEAGVLRSCMRQEEQWGRRAARQEGQKRFLSFV